MEKVNAEEIVFYKINDTVKVIVGDEIKKVEWKDAHNQYGHYTTLADIQAQFKEYYCFMVIAESPLSGAIYRFNNYGTNEWYKVGTMCGYA